MGRSSFRLGLVVALAITAPAWGLALHPHLDVRALFDGDTHLLRAHFLRELVGAGEWYPRWMPEQYGGYGYPTLTYYAPLTYYLLLALAALPLVGLHEAFQALSAGAGLALVAGAYVLGWRLWRSAPAAALGAALTAYAPFVLPDNVYRAGALPRVIGLALALWLLAACHGLFEGVGQGSGVRGQGSRVKSPMGRPLGQGDGRNPDRTLVVWWLAVAGLTGALLLTHNVTTLLTAPLAAVLVGSLWLAAPERRWRPLLVTLAAPVVGAVATAFFWLPAFLQTGLVQTERLHRGNLHYRNHFLDWPGNHPALWGEAWRSPWTPGWPVDLHVVFPYSSAGPPKLALWQASVLGVSAVFLVAAVVRGRAAYRKGTSPFPTAAGAGSDWWSRGTVLVGLAGVGLAVVTYAQQFDWSLPLWERYELVRSVQLPSRLLAFTGVGVALAAGSAVALAGRRPTADGRRPTSDRLEEERATTERLLWGAVVLVSGLAGVSSMRGLPVPLDAGRSPRVDEALAIQIDRASPGTTVSTNEFIPRTAFYEEWHEGEPRGFWLYERLFPDAGWLAGRVLVWEGTVGVRGLAGGALWTAAEVTSQGGGTLAFHQLAFPGWRAWVDGKEVALRAAPLMEAQAMQPGFILVDVPAGEHRVAIRFGGGAPDGREGPGKRELVYRSVVEEVLAGRAAVSSPTGSGLGADRFVDVRGLSIRAQDRPLRYAGARPRRWLYAHPPAEIGMDLVVPPDALFQTSLGLDPQVWTAALGDGVEYAVTLTPRGGQPVALLRQAVNPRAQGEQRRWLDVAVDLRPWAGQEVRLTLRTEGRQEPSNDWAGWGEPAVVRVDALTADRLLRSTEETRKVAMGT